MEFERAQSIQPAGTRSLIPLLVKGLSAKPINAVVRDIDAYYQAHPTELKRPVVDAIFQAIVLPTLMEKERRGK